MADYFKFAWRCIKEAAEGTFQFANAWGYLLGVAVVAFIANFWGLTLVLPENIQGYFAFVLMALGATWIVAFTVRLMGAPARLYWEQHQKATALETEIGTLKNPDGGPNWSIRELFYYLEPDVLEANRWQTAGNKIRDALSLGQITAWGRRFKTSRGEWVGERDALRPIDKVYWQNAYFTFFFFGPKHVGADCYADRTNGVPAYADLQVNREQILKLWPAVLP